MKRCELMCALPPSLLLSRVGMEQIDGLYECIVNFRFGKVLCVHRNWIYFGVERAFSHEGTRIGQALSPQVAAPHGVG